MYIDESFVSFIWQHCYFDTAQLTTTSNEKVLIKHPGYLNMHAGPDFFESKIKIGDINWIGCIEIHVNSSQWKTHDHSSNPDYNKVILHVVWKHDMNVYRNDNSPIPTLEIHDKVSSEVLDTYSKLMYCSTNFPCQPHLLNIKSISILSMIEKSTIERLEKKARDILKVFNDAGKNWEETAYRILAKNFGFKVNQENMYLMAKLLPHSILSKHRESSFQLEALLFGMAGFLEKSQDSYSEKLKYEYKYLSRKYDLNSNFLQRYQWKFLRLRPQNFPTIRLAQLAALIGKMDKIFSNIVEYNSIKSIMNLLKIKQSEYWIEHYDFGKKCKKRLSGIGTGSIRNILTNSFVPVLSAYAKSVNNENYMTKAIDILEAIPSENNHITRKWLHIGLKPINSFESQGLIELSNSYCCKKKCLNCNIGTEILLNNQ